MKMINEVLERLPVRYPFLFVDRIIEENKDYIKCYKNVTINEPFFNGHFPDQPIMPGVLILEAMTQTGGLLFSKIKNKCYLMQVKRAKFIRFVEPGDQLILSAKLITMLQHCAQVELIAEVDNELVAQAEISYSFQK